MVMNFKFVLIGLVLILFSVNVFAVNVSISNIIDNEKISGVKQIDFNFYNYGSDTNFLIDLNISAQPKNGFNITNDFNYKMLPCTTYATNTICSYRLNTFQYPTGYYYLMIDVNKNKNPNYKRIYIDNMGQKINISQNENTAILKINDNNFSNQILAEYYDANTIYVYYPKDYPYVLRYTLKKLTAYNSPPIFNYSEIIGGKMLKSYFVEDENANPNMTKSAGWALTALGGAYAGSTTYASGAGSWMDYNFTGNSVGILTGCSYLSGKITFTIDGLTSLVNTTQVDINGDPFIDLNNQRYFCNGADNNYHLLIATNLPDGNHTLRIISKGDGRTYVSGFFYSVDGNELNETDIFYAGFIKRNGSSILNHRDYLLGSPLGYTYAGLSGSNATEYAFNVSEPDGNAGFVGNSHGRDTLNSIETFYVNGTSVSFNIGDKEIVNNFNLLYTSSLKAPVDNNVIANIDKNYYFSYDDSGINYSIKWNRPISDYNWFIGAGYYAMMPVQVNTGVTYTSYYDVNIDVNGSIYKLTTVDVCNDANCTSKSAKVYGGASNNTYLVRVNNYDSAQSYFPYTSSWWSGSNSKVYYSFARTYKVNYYMPAHEDEISFNLSYLSDYNSMHDGSQVVDANVYINGEKLTDFNISDCLNVNNLSTCNLSYNFVSGNSYLILVESVDSVGNTSVNSGSFYYYVETVFPVQTCGVVGLLPLVLIALLIFFAVISFINIRDGDLQNGLVMLVIAGILLLVVFVFYGALYNIICV